MFIANSNVVFGLILVNHSSTCQTHSLQLICNRMEDKGSESVKTSILSIYFVYNA